MAPLPGSPLPGPMDWNLTSYRQPYGQPDYRQLEALWSALAPFGEPAIGQSLPLIELRQSEDDVIITATLPGIAPEAVQVQAQTHSLTLLGQQSVDRPSFYGHSVSYKAFQHTLPLPVPVRADQVQVLLQDGSLIITLPKARTWTRGARLMQGMSQRLTGRVAEGSTPLAEPAVASWLRTLRGQSNQLGQRWRQLKRWMGQQLHRLGDHLLEDW